MNLGEAVIIIAVMGSFQCSSKLPPGVDHNTYCECCLATVLELKKGLQVPSEEPRMVKTLIENTCRTAHFQSTSVPADIMKRVCEHLIEVHGEALNEVLQSRSKDDFEILLCYEHSLACTGVKRNNPQNNGKPPFKDQDIKILLEKNHKKVRFVNPVHSSTREEL
ncbi:hypothetical protein HHUSO_G23955 [Huso huso]|uniref:Saposin B-type domain-containing protein n=1 Tax=Huso huso TaxID=61971 RepID=A0ABR0YTM5_HUSHU